MEDINEIESTWWVFREEDISYDEYEDKWEHDISIIDAVRYMKGLHTNKARFINRCLNRAFQKTIERDENEPREYWEGVGYIWPEAYELGQKMIKIYDEVEAFSYQEAFAQKNADFRRKVFGTIDITQMITNLGHTRIKADGAKVTRKNYAKDGTFLGTYEKDVIFETYAVKGEKLGLRRDAYVVKCWCSTTKDEHWLWIEEQYKNDPLAAIASTCRVEDNILKAIKENEGEIKRQGDIFLFETGDVEVVPKGPKNPLSWEDYSTYLTTET